MEYRISSVCSPSDWLDFIAVPKLIYKNDPQWVCPLKSEVRRSLDLKKNPYFKNCAVKLFICQKHGVPIARLAVIINFLHWQRWNRKTAFFGFFEAMNDQIAVSLLFDQARNWCREKGGTHLQGPFNPNHYSELGLLIENFNSHPQFFEPYNPPYYKELLELTGFKLERKLHTRINRDVPGFLRRSIPNNIFSNRGGFQIRPFRLLDMKQEMERIREVNNEAFAGNWNFLPLSKKEYQFTSKYQFLVTTPKLIQIVEKASKPVGVLQCAFNINPLIQKMNGSTSPWNYLTLLNNRRSIKEIVIFSIGIKDKYRNSFAFPLILQAAKNLANKYPTISTTWMTENNYMAIKASTYLGLEPYKWFGIYEMVI